MVSTRKGCHVYVRLDNPGAVRTGHFYIDGALAGQVRFDGGYVVAPPSMHPSGARYVWRVEGEILTVSGASLHIIQPPQGLAAAPTDAHISPTLPRTRNVSQGPGVRSPEAYALAAVRREADRVRSARPGTRNTALFRAGLKVHRFRGVLPESDILAAVTQAGIDSGLSAHESRSVILKAWNTARY